MKNKVVKTIIALAVAVSLLPVSVSALTLKDIFGGKTPSLASAKEKKEQLIQYTKGKFKDMKSIEWYTENVSILVGLGGIDGYKNGNFAPKDSITVAQFVKILVSVFGYKVKQQAGTEWYMPYVGKAKENGIIESSDNYNYKSYMLRKDMAKIICKALKLEPRKNVVMPFKDLKPGLDTTWIGTAYSEYLMAGATVNGKEVFTPFNTATRAQACEMIVRALEYRDNPDQFKKEMEKKRKESQKTRNIGGFIVPVYDGTNLNSDEGGYEKYGAGYPVISFLLHTTYPDDVMKRERDQLREVLLQKFDKNLVDQVFEYIEQKKSRGTALPYKYFKTNKYEIRVGSSEDGYGSSIGVDIYSI